MRLVALSRARIGAVLAAMTVLALSLVDAAEKTPDERIVKVVAQRFHYTPGEIVLKKGEPVVLEISSLDFTHGFKVPELNIRIDLPPGQVTKVHLNPGKAGVYDFLCDNFCGSGHEEMNGRIVVTE